jgi:hypothetical protein
LSPSLSLSGCVSVISIGFQVGGACLFVIMMIGVYSGQCS